MPVGDSFADYEVMGALLGERARNLMVEAVEGQKPNFSFMAKRVPDGMKVMPYYGGFFEWTNWLMGLVPFSYILADDPDLVDAVTQKVFDYIYQSAAEIIEEPNIGGIFRVKEPARDPGHLRFRRALYPGFRQIGGELCSP